MAGRLQVFCSLCFVSLTFQLISCIAYPDIPEINQDVVEASWKRDGRPLARRYDWFEAGQDELRHVLARSRNSNVAKNLILFIGDGMGIGTTTAARIYKAQKSGMHGSKSLMAWERFPDIGLARVQSTDLMTPDSPSSATALLSGEKTRAQCIGVNHRCRPNDCASVDGNRVRSLLDWAHEAGRWSGIVTNTRVTHGTPAAAYAHVPFRHWEMLTPPEAAGVCKDIALQLVEDNPHVRVVLGGGRVAFLPNNSADPEHGTPGGRIDGRNLVAEWLLSKENARYAINSAQFAAVDPAQTDYLLGLFEAEHMNWESLRRLQNDEPSLAEMTEKAIRVLQRQEKGFFLLVEGGRIDHAHHNNTAYQVLEETLMFEQSVEKALQLVDLDETLIVVTSDHSQAMTLIGYPSIDNPILNVVDEMTAQDDLPMETITYANGPGGFERRNLTNVNTAGMWQTQFAGLPLDSSTHSGEDVGIYAIGAMSHLLSGSHEISYVAHAMSYAACIGRNTAHCGANEVSPKDNSFTGSAVSTGLSSPWAWAGLLALLRVLQSVG